MYRNKIIGILTLVLCCVFLIGCGGGRAQVSGKVNFEDGSPLTNGEIWALSGDGIRVKGFVKADGSYALFESMSGDGIPAGKQYKIWIANAIRSIPSTQMIQDETPGGGMIQAPPTMIAMIHDSFANPESTPLILDVPRGNSTMTHDIVVRKP